MQVECIQSLTKLACLAPAWQTLAQNIPFRRWEWIGTWWEHYGQDHRLSTLVIRNGDGDIRGIVPWYIENRGAQGRVIQFLGSGKACTDHLRLLCREEDEADVAAATVNWLVEHASDPADANDPFHEVISGHCCWDLVELIGVDGHDSSIAHLKRELEAHELAVHEQAGVPCCQLQLPNKWEEYWQMRSKSGRRVIRSAVERLDHDERVRVQSVTEVADLKIAWPIFRNLHQLRRNSLHEAGCFEFPPFGDFLFRATQRLMASGRAAITILWIDSEPAAATLMLHDGDVMYLYQSGIDPSFTPQSPGNLILTHEIRAAIERGCRIFDFLRGDEEYKMRWRAGRQSTVELRVVAPRKAAKLRHQVWLTGHSIKDWVKEGLEKTGWR